MSCAAIDALPNTTFTDAAVISNVGSNLQVQAALETCCGATNVYKISNGCYTYCNISSFFEDGVHLDVCLSDNLDLALLYSLDVRIFSSDSTNSGTSPNRSESNFIASTWPTLAATVTLSSAGRPYSTVTVRPLTEGVVSTSSPGRSSTTGSASPTGTTGSTSSTSTTTAAGASSNSIASTARVSSSLVAIEVMALASLFCFFLV